MASVRRSSFNPRLGVGEEGAGILDHNGPDALLLLMGHSIWFTSINQFRGNGRQPLLQLRYPRLSSVAFPPQIVIVLGLRCMAGNILSTPGSR